MAHCSLPGHIGRRTVNLTTTTLYRFGEFELDADQYELRREGRALHVEPRVLDLLIFLVRNRERVVAKEELLDNVWNAKFIGESALTRCIMQARKAIAPEDGGEDPIRTVHRRGYRFIASIIEESAEERTIGSRTFEESPDPPLPAAAAVDGARTMSVNEGAQAADGARIVPVRRWRLLSVVAVALALVSTLAVLRSHRGRPPSEAAKVVRLAIVPISAAADEDAETLLLATMVSDLLSTRLADVPNLVVRTPEESAGLSTSMGTLAELANRAGVDFVLSGSLRRVADAGKARVDLTLHKFGSKGSVETTSLGHYDVPFIRNRVELHQFIAIRDSIVARVIRELTPVIELRPLSGDAPQNAHAYRLYLLARDRLNDERCDGGGALELLERSLELDPTFAPAWEVLALAHYGLASSCGEDAVHYDKALLGIARALELNPGMPNTMALKATVLAETGRAEEAYASLRTKRKNHAVVPETDYAESSVLCYAGYLGEARRKLEAGLGADPHYLTMGGWTPNVYLHEADPDRFLRALPATETALFRYHRGYAQILQGRVAAARETLAPAFRLNPQDVFARLSSALLDTVEGRPAEAREILRGLERQRAVVGSKDGGLTYNIALLFERAGDSEAALVALNRAVDQGFFCAPCFAGDPLWNRVRSRPEFTAALRRAEARHVAFGKRFGFVAGVAPVRDMRLGS